MGEPIVIVSAVRTPVGAFQGVFKETNATTLGGIAIKGACNHGQLQPHEIDEVIMGCVLSAGLGQAPCRQALRKAGLDDHVHALTINKVCGSGLKAVMMAYDSVQLNPENIIIAGGMENMSMAPYLLAKAREGYRLGHGQLLDHMIFDGLEDAYNQGTSMGSFAEATAEKYGFTRAQQDQYAIDTATKAFSAQKSDSFKHEITPVTITNKKDFIEITIDEGPSRVKIDKIPSLKSVFIKDGTVTAATSSPLSDGAAAIVLMTETKAKQRGLKPLARIIAHASYSREPEWFTLAPIQAINRLLEKIQWSINDVDLFEINEAFAVVTMAAMKELNIPRR